MQRTNSPVEKSVPYKKRTLRSTTKSEIINTTNKTKKSDNYTSITDESIAKDTYSLEEEGENSDDTIKPNRQNKCNKTKDDQSKDVNMQESTHPISSEQDVPEVTVNETLQILHKETADSRQPIPQTLNDSVHSPNNNTTSPPNDESQSRDQGKIPNATNKEIQDQQQTNPNKDTIMLDTNDDFTSYGGQANHTVFTFLNSFKTYDNNLEGIINVIRTYFHSNDSFIGVSSRPIVIGQIPLIILRFNNKSYADALHNTFNDTLKVTFYKFDEETANKEITKYLEKIDRRTIKLVDIEVNFPTDTVIEVFQKVYGPIEKVQEIIKKPFNKQPPNATPNGNPNILCGQYIWKRHMHPRARSQRLQEDKALKQRMLTLQKQNLLIHIPNLTCSIPRYTFSFHHTTNRAQSVGNFTTFHRNTPSKQQFQPPSIPHIKPNNFAIKQPSILMNNWDNPIDEIKSEITALKSSLKDAHNKINTLEQENKNLKNQLTKLQTDILNNHKVTIAIKEQNSRVEIKQDQILEQLNSLFQQLGGNEQDYEPNMDDMSDNASQSNYEYSDDTHITRIVYIDGDIIFHEENLDLPPIGGITQDDPNTSTNLSILQRTAHTFGFGNI
ncbi:hypothetical protein RCL_jg11277.t1 [Rhizophagus clarus]|uniref:Uncharacterized protein n=2 Tax=Rhizophagus clarus TaxID=94130 RepID=A0A8H3LKD6_9GLOM|nr:hypothetical protein RCL_jg11277.t1 [Rhizophagus clarus]